MGTLSDNSGVRGDRKFHRRPGASRNKLRCFKVMLVIPEGATEDEVMDYIEDAVVTWKGQLHPDHPIRELDTEKVVVKRRSPKYRDQE